MNHSAILADRPTETETASYPQPNSPHEHVFADHRTHPKHANGNYVRSGFCVCGEFDWGKNYLPAPVRAKWATNAETESKIKQLIERRSNPNWSKPKLAKPSKLPKLADAKFQQMWAENMARFGQLEPGETVFDGSSARVEPITTPKGGKLYPVAETRSGSWAIVKRNVGAGYNVTSRLHGGHMPPVYFQDGKRQEFGTTTDREAFSTQRQALAMAQWLEDTYIFDEDSHWQDLTTGETVGIREVLKPYALGVQQ